MFGEMIFFRGMLRYGDAMISKHRTVKIIDHFSSVVSPGAFYIKNKMLYESYSRTSLLTPTTAHNKHVDSLWRRVYGKALLKNKNE